MSAANAVLPDLLWCRQRHQPGVDGHLEHTPVHAQVLALRQRHIDIGLFGLPAVLATGRLVEPLLRDPHVLAVPNDHPLASSVELGPVPLHAVREEPFVFWPRPMAPSPCAIARRQRHRRTAGTRKRTRSSRAGTGCGTSIS